MEKTEILPIDLDRTVRHFVRRVRRVHEAVDSPAAMAAALERVLESWSEWWRQNSTRDRVARHLYALMLEPAPADDPFYFLTRRALWDLYRRVAGLHRRPRRGDVLEYRPFGEVKARYRVERLERHVCFIVDEDTGETTQFIWGFPEDGALNAVFSIVGEARDAERGTVGRARKVAGRARGG